MIKFFTLVLSLSLVPLSVAHSWGGRGHHVICSAAVHLVEEKGLRDFVQGRGHTLGHLCNVPDIYWKSLPAEVSKEGNAAHFIDPEVIGVKIPQIDEDFGKIVAQHTGAENKFKAGATIRSVPDDFGSLFWRADQFVQRVAGLKETFKGAATPMNRKEEQDEKLAYNQAVYSMMVDLGLLGHFVGDAGQPFHTTADYDGYTAGHGGIHSYYEEQTVTQAPADLEARVAREAARLKTAPWLKPGTVVARMKQFSEESQKDIPKILAADPVLKKSSEKKEKGMSLREEAKRQDAGTGWKKFESLTVRNMARSARLLARFWDEAYAAAGRPDLSAYKSYRYPFTPDYVPLNYLGPVDSKTTSR